MIKRTRTVYYEVDKKVLAEMRINFCDRNSENFIANLLQLSVGISSNLIDFN